MALLDTIPGRRAAGASPGALRARICPSRRSKTPWSRPAGWTKTWCSAQQNTPRTHDEGACVVSSQYKDNALLWLTSSAARSLSLLKRSFSSPSRPTPLSDALRRLSSMIRYGNHAILGQLLLLSQSTQRSSQTINTLTHAPAAPVRASPTRYCRARPGMRRRALCSVTPR